MKKEKGAVINILQREKNVTANNTRRIKVETQERKRGSSEFKTTALRLYLPRS